MAAAIGHGAPQGGPPGTTPGRALPSATMERSDAAARRRRVAVIGAGWAGIAAAVTLAAAGTPVTLFEAGRQPGGRARRVELDGLPVDNGQHLLIGAYAATLALMRQVGVEPAAVLARLPMRMLVPGVFDLRLPRLPAPLHSATGLLLARGADLREKWAALRAMRALQANGYRLAADTTLAAWLNATGQHGALRRYLWEALCLAALNTPAARASAQIFANVLRDTLGATRDATDFLLPTVPLDELLPTPAVRWLDARGTRLRLACRVAGVRAVAGDGWHVEAGEDRETFTAVIVAVAPQHVPALLPASPALTGLHATLAAFAWEPIATVYARYPPGTRLPERILALPGPLAQWVVDRGALAAEAHGPADGLFAHVLSASDDWQALADDELAAALHRELASCLTGLPAPLGQRVLREKRATFACVPQLARPANATALPGLWLAGDYTASDYPATLEAAVRSGIAAARGVLGEPLVAG